MDIRRKLTFRFISIVALILLGSSLAIYWSSAEYRQDDFYNRLLSKASSTAKLLIEVEEVDAALLHRIEENNPLSLPDEKVVIYNYRNERLFSTDAQNELAVKLALLDQIRLEGELRYRQAGHEVVGFLFTDTYDRFVVIAGGRDIYGLRKLANLRNILLLVFAVSIVLVSISGWVYAGRALSPISRLVQRVNKISISNLDTRLEEGPNQDEIAELAQTFNRMLERLEKAFRMQKNFIANASHELRTPLSAITGQLEVMLMQERSSREYQNTLASVLEDIRNLNQIANQLLLLAQTSAEDSANSASRLRLDDLLWQVRQELLKHHPNYQVEVAFADSMEDDQQLTIAGNEALLKTALANLIENACKYSADQRVEILLEPGDTELRIYFRDQGIGINAEELKHIFEPFYRGKNALGYKGHGLGLSLVRRIAELHQARLSVESQSGAGSCFRLSFPYPQA